MYPPLILPLLFYHETRKKGGRLTKGYVTPTWNHIYYGNRTLTKWANMYKYQLIGLMKEWKKTSGWETTSQKTIVNIWVTFPDNRIRDCHNLDKILLDAMEEAQIFTNDRYALVRYQDYNVDVLQPKFTLTLEVMT